MHPVHPAGPNARFQRAESNSRHFRTVTTVITFS
jgi:hypothetical protein